MPKLFHSAPKFPKEHGLITLLMCDIPDTHDILYIKLTSNNKIGEKVGLRTFCVQLCM